MEVLVGAPTEQLRKIREDFLRQFAVIELDERVAREAIALRQEHRLKLPDAIIWASARLKDALLVTRNSKDFSITRAGDSHSIPSMNAEILAPGPKNAKCLLMLERNAGTAV